MYAHLCEHTERNSRHALPRPFCSAQGNALEAKLQLAQGGGCGSFLPQGCCCKSVLPLACTACHSLPPPHMRVSSSLHERLGNVRVAPAIPLAQQLLAASSPPYLLAPRAAGSSSSWLLHTAYVMKSIQVLAPPGNLAAPLQEPNSINLRI